MEREEEEKSLEQEISDNDFAEKFYKLATNFIISIALIIIVSIALFGGTPDMIDSIITYLQGANKCL